MVAWSLLVYQSAVAWSVAASRPTSSGRAVPKDVDISGSAQFLNFEASDGTVGTPPPTGTSPGGVFADAEVPSPPPTSATTDNRMSAAQRVPLVMAASLSRKRSLV
jgi:hypothetical protein